MRLFIGIDPGKSGGIAVLTERGEVERVLKLRDATESDIVAFLAAISPLGGRFAMLERVHSMPKQGVVSAFSFGQSYGLIRGVLAGLGIPRETVSPAVWQKSLACLSRGDKRVTRARAEELWPQEKWTHDIADAALLAEYCRRLKW